MSTEKLISASDFCAYQQIELSFVQHLHDSGLIVLTIRDGSFFLSAGELPALEKFSRWFYELEINTAGIEALSHVLGRMEALLEENRVLRNKLHVPRPDRNAGI